MNIIKPAIIRHRFMNKVCEEPCDILNEVL